ncbi:MAG TPA: hypothetical protein VH482_09150 [Thermomicrobiales bacterium]
MAGLSHLPCSENGGPIRYGGVTDTLAHGTALILLSAVYAAAAVVVSLVAFRRRDITA